LSVLAGGVPAGDAAIAARDPMVVGASLSLSGRFQRQGEQARDGLRLWADYSAGTGDARAPRLIVLDDASRASVAQANVWRLLTEHRIDVLVGPYSSGLVRAVAPIAGAAGKVLWNHGGSSDTIVAESGPHVVSVASEASNYLRGLPGWVRRHAPEATRMTLLHAGPGTFARQVARGAVEAARAAGFTELRITTFEPPLRDASAVVGAAAETEPDLLIGVGGFPDDLAITRERARLPGGTLLALVGAGLAAFGDELGDLAEGVIGPSQWEPATGEVPLVGPDSEWFARAFEDAFHRAVEYPAAQAFALGLIVAECRRRCAGNLDDRALLDAARALETATFYGGFRLDPATGRQVGHQVRLVQWGGGRKRLLR
jgi:ABC-type branched-subunit amino acid transport system substrate-binding protein